MATIYSTLGTYVTIVEIFDSVLPILDTDISTACEKSLKKRGMEILLSSKVVSSEIIDNKVEVAITMPSGEKKMTFDVVLVAVGMKPNTENLNLKAAGVKLTDKGFVVVDKQMRTNIPNIFAIGDVVGGLLLAHKASHEGIVAAETIAGKTHTADWKAVPYAVFTDPEIAGIGMTEKEAGDSGKNIKIGRFPYRAVGKAIATLAPEGFAKVIAEEKTDKILGIHIFGPHSGDIISAATTIIEMGGTSEDLGRMMAVHPTLSEALMEAAMNVNNKAIHIPN